VTQDLSERFGSRRSDGAQPHLVNIQFQKKVRLKVCWMRSSASKFAHVCTHVVCCRTLAHIHCVVRVCASLKKVLWRQELEIYADFKQDESYTPNKISVRAGNSFHDLRVRAFVSSGFYCSFEKGV
jgi:hypothetical protein